MKLKKTMTALLCALFFSGLAVAESRYITDIVYVPLRSGPGNQYKIIHNGIRTGARLTLLEQDAGNEFSKVMTSAGQEGYIRTQYLLEQPPARVQLPETLEKLAKLTQQQADLRQQLKAREEALGTATAEVEAARKSLTQQRTRLKQVLEVNANTLVINQRNKQLAEENLQLKDRVQKLEANNGQLRQDSSYRWYLYGSGTVLMGILLGLILPRVRVRKKQSGWV